MPLCPSNARVFTAAPQTIDTVSKACAFGDFEKLRAFFDSDPSSINAADASGYYPLQWAALNNRLQEANFLLSKQVQINAADGTGQTALHWATVRGSLPVIEALLRAGADYEIKDNRGYTAIHVAAQYGQTAVLYHLVRPMHVLACTPWARTQTISPNVRYCVCLTPLQALKWGIDMDQPDNDGRTPLHWAAYKGYADTIRLLLVLDARYDLADKEGCTPLHWAAIKGNGEACTVLLQGGSMSELTTKDVTGLTPAQLALEKGHRYCSNPS